MNWTAAGTKYVEHEEEGGDARAAAKAYWEKYGRAPDTVEGHDQILHVIGMCEGCQEAIFADEKYGTDHKPLLAQLLKKLKEKEDGK